MKKNLIVFDIDGTIADTSEQHHLAFRKALKEAGAKKFDQDFSVFRHYTDSYISKTILEKDLDLLFNIDQQKAFEQIIVDELKNQEIKPILGAIEFVKKVEESTTFAYCFATGAFRKPAKLKLDQLGVPHKRQQLVACNQYHSREQIVAKAIENAKKIYGVDEFENVISIGDGVWDFKAAQSLGLQFVGIGKENKDALLMLGATKHYNHFQNLKLNDLMEEELPSD